MTLADKRGEFIKYIDEKYKPKFVYYPGCGADNIPKYFFGDERVIHLSLPENEEETKYLERLGEGIKLLGDMNCSPLADNCVDLIWINLRGMPLSKEAIEDFKRVLKKNGLIAVEDTQNTEPWRNKWQKRLDDFGDFEPVDLPNWLCSAEVVFTVSKSGDNITEFEKNVVNDEAEMIEGVAGKNGQFVGNQFVMDRALFRKMS